MSTTYITHDLGTGCDVAPGVSLQVTARPQRGALRPRSLYIDPEIAKHYRVVDVTIGNRSQLQQSTSGIPATQFSSGSGAEWSCEIVQHSMDFVMIVTRRNDPAYLAELDRIADSPAVVTVALGKLPAVRSRGWWIFKKRTCARCGRALKREPACSPCSGELTSAANAVRDLAVKRSAMTAAPPFVATWACEETQPEPSGIEIMAELRGLRAEIRSLNPAVAASVGANAPTLHPGD